MNRDFKRFFAVTIMKMIQDLESKKSKKKSNCHNKIDINMQKV